VYTPSWQRIITKQVQVACLLQCELRVLLLDRPSREMTTVFKWFEALRFNLNSSSNFFSST